MKALFTFKSAINQSTVVATIALISLISVIYPEVSLATISLQAEGQNTAALVFEIKNPTKIETQSSLTIKTILENDPLADLLEDYLVKYKSPLAPYAKDMIALPNWKKALSISFVESNMCRRHVDNNCSGIGVAPGHPLWRKYKTHYDWFVDMDKLMDKPMYSQKYTTFRKMKGVYVQPGSESWVRGAEKIYAELTGLEDQAAEARYAAQVSGSSLALANSTSGYIFLK